MVETWLWVKEELLFWSTSGKADDWGKVTERESPAQSKSFVYVTGVFSCDCTYQGVVQVVDVSEWVGGCKFKASCFSLTLVQVQSHNRPLSDGPRHISWWVRIHGNRDKVQTNSIGYATPGLSALHHLRNPVSIGAPFPTGSQLPLHSGVVETSAGAEGCG